MSASSQYYKVTSRVGVPHRHEVEVTVPLVGPVGPAGPQGAQGPPGEVSGSIAWDNVTGKPTIPAASSTTPAALGTAAVGLASTFARADHVHAMPTAANVGAEIDLEYLSVSTPSVAPFNLTLLPNKYYSLTKETTDEVELLLNQPANAGDRITIRWSGGASTGNLVIRRLGGNPFVQTIGVMRSQNEIFHLVFDGLWRSAQNPPSGLNAAPSTPTSSGFAGDMAYADPYLYVCVANNNWRRVPVAAW